MYYTLGAGGLSKNAQAILERVNDSVENARANLLQRIKSEIVTTHGSIDSLKNALYNVNYLDNYIIERWRQRASLVTNNDIDYQRWVSIGNIFIQSMRELTNIGIEGTPTAILENTIAKTRDDIIALPKRATRKYWPIIVGVLGVYLASQWLFREREN